MKKKNWLWVFPLIALIGRGVYYYQREVKREKEAERVRQAQVVRQFNEEQQRAQRKQVSEGLAKIVGDTYLNGYQLEKDGETYTLKDSAGTVVLDQIEEYENTQSSLFVFVKEDGIYAVNTKTNAQYGPYRSASVVQLVKGEQSLSEKGLAYRENDRIYVLRQDGQTEVKGTEGNFETATTFTYMIDSGMLRGG
ncbi:hypothetical protein [Streptococcus cuniculi]|uniref:Uncharacterized protein n=1 Tax=Streptococcus cuniculi TaxID=1432788 RepID=A0A4Y9JD22_9STRE|nr:hypothetical protein [Streptococcus cuniculi]MBF0778073.1 hypothetical protein [Streptococcus cuniculi]TFU98078.1 hypothetical protein E4T82_04985 [Streptococcus cuniculi]